MPRFHSCTIGTVGDISFKGRYENQATGRVLSAMQPVFDQMDFMVANLESPLVPPDLPSVPAKCALRGISEWAGMLRQAGIDLVTLANNHMMDYGEDGLFSTINALDKAGITHVGAGKNRQAACRPIFKEIAGNKIAFVARSRVEVSSRCYAGSDRPGVAFLEEEELAETIAECRENADIVIVMLHWGMEHYHYPSPEQRRLAQRIVAAGADILLGHHPHVVQGEEMIGNALVSYSSGNFLFDEFSWTGLDASGRERLYLSTLTEKNREGMLLEIDISEQGAITSQRVFTRITRDGVVKIDGSLERKREYQKFSSRLGLSQYDRFWKIYSLKREWDLRLSSQLSPGHIVRNIYKIRPRHFKEIAVKLRRSARITSGKSTNPYEG